MSGRKARTASGAERVRWICALACLAALSVVHSPLALGAESADTDAATAEESSAKAESSRVDLISIDDQIINPVVLQYIQDGIKRAEDDGAQCLLIELDTPGGLLQSTRGIVKAFLASHVPIVVYVTPPGARAASAGVFITMAAHVAAMAPSTNIGAAHPVMENPTGGDAPGGINKHSPGELRPKTKSAATSSTAATTKTLEKQNADEGFQSDDVMTEKVMNDTLAWISGIARMRHRNVEWARRAVTQSVSIGEDEAVRQNVVDLIAADVPALLNQIDGRKVALAGTTHTLHTRSAAITRIPMTAREHFLMIITLPDVAYLLMMLGTIGLIFEFTHPGTVFPGVGGLICVLLALYSFQALPVNFMALALIVIGVGLLVGEAFATSHGLMAFGGLVCLALGSFFLFESPDASLEVSPSVVIATTIAIGAIVLFIVSRAVKAMRTGATTGAEGMIGSIGKALGDLAPEGMIFIHGERWRAWAPGASIREGQPVRVVAMDGLRLTVQAAEPQAIATEERANQNPHPLQ